MHITPSGGRAILDKILENTPSTEFFQELQHDHELGSDRDEPLMAVPEPTLLTPFNLALKLGPESQSLKEEAIQPLGLAFDFEDDIFEDYGNTSNYSSIRKPMLSTSSYTPLDEEFLAQTIKGLTSILSSEWLNEVETSFEAI